MTQSRPQGVGRLAEHRTINAADAKTGDGASLRPIWLCADDYGISESVDKAIRDLLMRGHINATSVMVAAPSFQRAEAASLKMLSAGTRRFGVGLHLTLTAPFKPMSAGFRPTRSGAFLPLAEMLVRGTLRLLDRDRLAIEIATQLKAFVTAFGRAPDFVDGHQHVHLFPQVREPLLEMVKEAAPNAWVRQCGRVRSGGLSDRKALLLDALSRRFRALAGAQDIRTNPAFAGTYDFGTATADDFAKRFPGFLKGLPPQSVVMCHPGFVDAELERLDPLTKLRESEYAYFAAEGFPAVLRANGVVLA
ncbi:MAG: ChbG/HpnK family deacetylase [Xanthobacteraceae bacterium]|nr:ChbG/HpnK family deacetylase [Xanthobacteraceae bacterium]